MSWFIWLYKTKDEDSIEGYYVTCQNDNDSVEQYVGVIDNNFNKLSYEEFAALEGSSCNTDSGTHDVLANAFNGMLSKMGIHPNGISYEAPSDEDLTEKALYYYSV